jgi:hypothetical protein
MQPEGRDGFGQSGGVGRSVTARRGDARSHPPGHTAQFLLAHPFNTFSQPLTTELGGEHHVTIPNHVPLRLGTFKSILKLVALRHGISIEELLEKLDL